MSHRKVCQYTQFTAHSLSEALGLENCINLKAVNDLLPNISETDDRRTQNCIRNYGAYFAVN